MRGLFARQNPKPKETIMKLFTEDQRRRLLANGKENAARAADQETEDFKPVVKLFSASSPRPSCQYHDLRSRQRLPVRYKL
jgi:hypothetical protein